MNPIFCFFVLTTLVGIEGQLKNVQPQKEDLIKDMKLAIEQAVKAAAKQLPKVFVEVNDVGNCQKTVKADCPCGRAKCVRRTDHSCSNELTKCCPINYALECCGTGKKCFDDCVAQALPYDEKPDPKERQIICASHCLQACDHCTKAGTKNNIFKTALWNCLEECSDKLLKSKIFYWEIERTPRGKGIFPIMGKMNKRPAGFHNVEEFVTDSGIELVLLERMFNFEIITDSNKKSGILAGGTEVAGD
uniref:Uncharacterized protein n=1 Tax=Globodera rostochiensis TaxID=31243 RepID=A0A914GYV7_GLORO